MNNPYNESQVKKLVSGLRRELTQFQGGGMPSHNQMLEIVAKSLGHASASAMLAALDTPASSPAAPAPSYAFYGEEEEVKQREKLSAYRLFNQRGLLDLQVPGETAEYMVTRFKWCPLTGTVESLVGVAVVNTVSHDSAEPELVANYEGDTEVDWNAQESRRDSRGVRLWTTENSEYYPEDSCLAVSASLLDAPEGPASEGLDGFTGATGPNVRVPLVDSVFRYLKDHNLVQQAFLELGMNRESHAFRELGMNQGSQLFGPKFMDSATDIGSNATSALGRAQFAAGFAMHRKEFRLLVVFLNA